MVNGLTYYKRGLIHALFYIDMDMPNMFERRMPIEISIIQFFGAINNSVIDKHFLRGKKNV